MYEFCPYFTNDGTVGLFSSTDDDIYHSTYGALSESWQKFIIPSHLEQYINSHDNVKILDICYGIGYNTKAALNVFVNNSLKKKKYFKNKVSKKVINSFASTPSIATIYTDNLPNDSACESQFKNIKNNCENESVLNFCSEEIYSDNICFDSNTIITKNNCKISRRDSEDFVLKIKPRKMILIDAVDIDKVLIGLSPFITRGKSKFECGKTFISKFFKSNEVVSRFMQVKKRTNYKFNKLPKKLKLRKEVQMILLEKLFDQNPEIIEDSILKSLLSQNKFLMFYDKFMINYAIFYKNYRCKTNQKQNKLAFLHNIYYRYISRSYKNVQNLSKNNFIDLNFHPNDARLLIKEAFTKYDLIFLDAFTPAKCPALWTVEFFKELHLKLDNDGMILTYSNSAAIRNALLQNGFFVGKIYDKSSAKFVGTIATKNKSLVEYSLDARDLALINSKAGICFRDENLNLDNAEIIKNREYEVACSNLKSSTKVLKEFENAKN